MTIRQGVKFQDGEPLNSDAVVFTINEYRNNPKSLGRSILSTLADVHAIDDQTIELIAKAANNAVPALMTRLSAIPPKDYQAKGSDGFGRQPVGTGPYQFQTLSQGQSVTAVAYKAYWRGAPKLAGITWAFSPDVNSRVALLQSGAADLISDLTVQQQAGVKDAAGLQLIAASSRAQMTMFLADNRPPLNNKTLRQAAAEAVDVDSILKGIFKGTGAVAAPGMLTPLLSNPANGNLQFTKYSPDDAKNLVKSVGGSPTLTLTYTVGAFPNDQQVGEAVAAMLEDVGFTVRRNVVDAVGVITYLSSKQISGVLLYQIIPTYPHPDVFTRVFMVTTSTSQSCHDSRIDSLAAQGLAAPSSQAMDDVYRQVEDIALNQDYCFRPLYYVVSAWGATTKVHGFTAPRDVVPNFYPAWLSK